MRNDFAFNENVPHFVKSYISTMKSFKSINFSNTIIRMHANNSNSQLFILCELI